MGGYDALVVGEGIFETRWILIRHQQIINGRGK